MLHQLILLDQRTVRVLEVGGGLVLRELHQSCFVIVLSWLERKIRSFVPDDVVEHLSVASGPKTLSNASPNLPFFPSHFPYLVRKNLSPGLFIDFSYDRMGRVFVMWLSFPVGKMPLTPAAVFVLFPHHNECRRPTNEGGGRPVTPCHGCLPDGYVPFWNTWPHSTCSRPRCRTRGPQVG